jgi:23S rRNA pseudouridine1911/1915/1917 synthase
MPEELEAQPGRLDAVVARLTGERRAVVQRAIDAGKVTVDGAPRPRSFRLRGGERVLADVSSDDSVPPEGPAVPVRYRDEHLLVVAKPAGLVTHPTEGRRTGTLVNRLLGMSESLSQVGGPLRQGIVHRLDAGTSGLMIVAVTDESHEALASMFRRHRIERRYLTLVRGSAPHDAFTVEAPLRRRAARIIVDRVEGRASSTGFAVRERHNDATLIEAVPRTGRTHQIRVHLASVGHPVLGDRRYGGVGEVSRSLGLDRPFLHAWRIEFQHPITHVRIALEEPLPSDLETALARLRGLGA